MSFSESQIKVQEIVHLGIVAGIIDEISLVEQINQLLGTHPQEIISSYFTLGVSVFHVNSFINDRLFETDFQAQ
ncbi:MAG: DUF4277 domain-containing protein [Richelia sp.]|nr:DUF4277 domain-containing protein [Richelia sp.]